MKDFSLRLFALFYLLHCISLEGQETYQLEHSYMNGVRTLEMYEVDIAVGSYSHLFSLETSRMPVEKLPFENLGATMPYDIVDFEYSMDRKEVYFLEINGNLFRYHIEEDTVYDLGDLSPLEPDHVSAGRWDFFLICSGMLWLEPGVLYIYGNNFLRYHVEEDSVELIYRPASWEETSDFFNRRIQYQTCVQHKGKYIGKNAWSEATGYYEVDLENPLQSEQIWDAENMEYYSLRDNMIVYKESCDSAVLLSQTLLEGEATGSTWFVVDPDDQSYSMSYPIGLYSPSLYGSYVLDMEIKHYSGFTEEYCNRSIDLDGDDDTAIGLDFWWEAPCEELLLPLSDIDVEIRNEGVLDSLVIELGDNSSGAVLSFMTGPYDLEGNLSDRVRLISDASTSNADLEDAIREARILLSNISDDSVRVVVTPWHDGESGVPAIARIALLTHPDAGEDLEIVLCDPASELNLYDLLEEGVEWSGEFLDSDMELVPGGQVSLDFADATYIYHLISQDGCEDQSTLQLTISRRPMSLDLDDQRLCPGDALLIDLSALEGDILWMDGTALEVREITMGGEYQLVFTDSVGCSYASEFEVSVYPSPSEDIEVVWICDGDSYVYDLMVLEQEGLYLDTLQGLQGCDSIYRGLELRIHEPVPIEIEGVTTLCAGETIEWDLLSDHTDVLINGQELQTTYLISEPGEYVLEGWDEHGCPSELLMEVVGLESPEVNIASVWDTVFHEGLELQPMYSADVVSYRWTPETGLSCGDCPYPEVLTGVGAVYEVVVENTDGCQDSASVELRYGTTGYYLANVLGRNSVASEHKSLFLQSEYSVRYDIQVYDRWGSLIYEGRNFLSNDAQGGWRPEMDFPSGVYVYLVKVWTGTEELRLYGDVTVLLRRTR